MPNSNDTLEDLIAAFWESSPREFHRRTPEIIAAIHATRTPLHRVLDRLAQTCN
jgi:hypothetical protein